MSNKVAAEKLIKMLVRQGAELDSYLSHVRAICGENEFEKYKKIVGIIMGAMLLDGINVLSAEFPDLKPDELDWPDSRATARRAQSLYCAASIG